MPVSDLSYVTQTYIEVIKRGFANSAAWTQPVPSILPVSPITLNTEGIGFYLYHVNQKKEYDNVPVPSRDHQVRFLPMALSLHYQLTANSILKDEFGPYNEQLMMSIAMKAIHDSPFIDDSTVTANNTTPVINPNIQGNENRLHITQEPVPATDAVRNWTAGQSPMKLSAYYEVSTVFLEPDDISSYTGRVLVYGNYVFQKGAPRISGIQNTVAFTIPGEATPRTVKIQPAQTPPAAAAPAPVNQASILNFLGEGFEGGAIGIRLLHPRFKESVVAGPDWDAFNVGSGTITATVREKAVTEKTNAPVDILPGVYAAQVMISKTITLQNGLSHEFKNSSNQYPFIISPRISVGLLAGSIVPVTGYIFQYIDIVSALDILKDKIEVYVDGIKFIRNDSGPFAQGEFRVVNPSAMDINLPGVITPGMNLSLRIIIDGAESPPAWIHT